MPFRREQTLNVEQKLHFTPLSDGKLYSLLLSVAIWNSYEYFLFWAGLNDT